MVDARGCARVELYTCHITGLPSRNEKDYFRNKISKWQPFASIISLDSASFSRSVEIGIIMKNVRKLIVKLKTVLEDTQRSVSTLKSTIAVNLASTVHLHIARIPL